MLLKLIIYYTHYYYYLYHKYHDFTNPQIILIKIACLIYYLIFLSDFYSYVLDVVLLHLTTLKTYVMDTSESRCTIYV